MKISHLRSTLAGMSLLFLASCARDTAPTSSALTPTSSDAFQRAFDSPSSLAKPWVYWYFMDGHITREGLRADLEAMKASGIGGAIFLTVDIGVPRGPVAFMSPEWQELFVYAVHEADRLGIEITLGVGPGWTGSGGPWVKPEDSMQHLVASVTEIQGAKPIDIVLEQPKPRDPFFGRGTLTPEMLATWQSWYRDVAVLAYPTPTPGGKIAIVDEKAIYQRAPYSSAPGVRPYFDAFANPTNIPLDQCLPIGQAIDLTDNLGTDGRLQWDAPPGDWTIYRFGRTLTGQTTRPAPLAGLGFESDKFNKAAAERHIASFLDPLLKKIGKASGPHRGLTLLHFDSWEMSAQNWSDDFRNEFRQRRGYDPLPYLPAMLGQPVNDAATSERFLWDLRQTARELVYDNHALVLRDYAHKNGLQFSVEPYDMNPSADLKLGSSADVPMGEFWSKGMGFKSEFSVIEAVSVGHTNGKPIIGAEAFTAESNERWQQYPGRMKAQTDWALAAGLNRFVIHRYQHQPKLDEFPGMRMGEYGVHWERTQTWWPMVSAYHEYVTRCSEVLRTGLPVADILYLAPEGAPHVFRPPSSATWGDQLDRRGHNFDGCDVDTLIERATVLDGQIVFPDGMSYRVLVLPRYDTMTPALLKKVKSLLEAGATVIGPAPKKSPSLSGYPASDAEVEKLAKQLWGSEPFKERRVGKGLLVNDVYAVDPATADPFVESKWIWQNDGTPSAMAAPGACYLEKRFSIDALSPDSTATLWITADDRFEVSINGKSIGSGADFHNVKRFDVLSTLQTGENTIRVTAGNDGNSPNPAGLIATLVIRPPTGEPTTVRSDQTWTSSETLDGSQAKVKLIADPPADWNVARSGELFRDLYADYDMTSSVLKSIGLEPDFASDVELRYAHRRIGQTDLYFIANPSDVEIATTAHFRVRSDGLKPEWWDPITGERRALTEYSQANGVTTLNLRLGPTQSGFVVFQHTASKLAPKAPNFPALTTRQTLAGPWIVAFDPAWGGPASVMFDRLEDWSTHSNPAIRNYSGQATYRITFDSPNASELLIARKLLLSLGDVKVMARVKLNGSDLGIVWCDPWQVEIPRGLLKSKNNSLEVTVANLWINRLIGDADLTPATRRTKTSSNPFRPDAPLERSGLIGPVELRVLPQ